VGVNSRDEDGLTPIHNAIFHNDYEGDYPQVIQLLLEHGANPNAQDNQRRTPLHLVSSSSRLDFARILLAHGADADAEDEEGITPLQVALARRQSEMAQLLSEYCSK